MKDSEIGALLERLEVEVEELVGLITHRPTAAVPWSDLVNSDPVRDVQAFKTLVQEHLAGPKEEAGDAPCQFLFGFDDPFGDGGLYVWIVSEPYYAEHGYMDDSSSASSAVGHLLGSGYVTREDKYEDDEESERDTIHDKVSIWLERATKGILYGEGMESCWDTGWPSEHDRKLHADRPEVFGELKDPYEGKTRDQAIEQIKAALIERGFKHEPKLDQDADE